MKNLKAHLKIEKKTVDLLGFVHEGETGIRIWFNDGSGGILNQSFLSDLVEIMQGTGILDLNGREVHVGQTIKDTWTNRFYTIRLGYCKEHRFTGFYCFSPDKTTPLNGDNGTNQNHAIEVVI